MKKVILTFLYSIIELKGEIFKSIASVKSSFSYLSWIDLKNCNQRLFNNSVLRLLNSFFHLFLHSNYTSWNPSFYAKDHKIARFTTIHSKSLRDYRKAFQADKSNQTWYTVQDSKSVTNNLFTFFTTGLKSWNVLNLKQFFNQDNLDSYQIKVII
ncbi:MAG: hypothetical protein ABI851_10965 [Saprospiraceae bacterium]